jgi:hypothetical protein
MMAFHARHPTRPAIFFEFWDKMIGAFFSYMGTSAMCFLNPEAREASRLSIGNPILLIHQSRLLHNKFRNDTPVPLFQPELRGFHTIFDYVIGSKTLTNQAGKALSGWASQRDNNEIITGGLPPVLTSI